MADSPRTAQPVTAGEQAVIDLISADEIVELTQALVAAPGENPPGGESATTAVLAEACRSRDLRGDAQRLQQVAVSKCLRLLVPVPRLAGMGSLFKAGSG